MEGAIAKSGSSDSVEIKQHPICQSSTDPIIHTGKSRKIFKLFRRSKEKDRKDLKTVQKLCRHSLEVDIERIEQANAGNNSKASPSTSGGRSSLQPESDASRACSTLPRHSDQAVDVTSTRSCPSSPVAHHKNKAAAWIARGKEFLKGRSPSPNVKSNPR